MFFKNIRSNNSFIKKQFKKKSAFSDTLLCLFAQSILRCRIDYENSISIACLGSMSYDTNSARNAPTAAEKSGRKVLQNYPLNLPTFRTTVVSNLSRCLCKIFLLNKIVYQRLSAGCLHNVHSLNASRTVFLVFPEIFLQLCTVFLTSNTSAQSGSWIS